MRPGDFGDPLGRDIGKAGGRVEPTTMAILGLDISGSFPKFLVSFGYLRYL
jgi:hypothetical protein